MDPATLSTFFKGLEFPANRDAVETAARHNEAPADVMEAISAMPQIRYMGMADVMNEYSKVAAAAVPAPVSEDAEPHEPAEEETAS